MIIINNSEGILNKVKNLFSPIQSLNTEGIASNAESISYNSDNSPLIANVPLAKSLDDSCLKSLGNNTPISSQERRILFKVEKNKFEYPITKTTDLYSYLNLPIVESVEITQTPRSETYTVPVGCPNTSYSGSTTINYTDVDIKLFVSFSVALYNVSPCKEISEACIDLRNLDLYALEKDSFFNAPYSTCFTGNVPKFLPTDFLITLTTSDETVSPICEFSDYYLYEVDVTINIELAPSITINPTDTITMEALNKALGNINLSNNIFTQGELLSITDLNLSNNPNLDFSVFQYLKNLITLNISNTTSDISKLSYLTNLVNLEVLICNDNYITDYTVFSTILSLKELYLNNDINTLSVELFTLPIIDISPLTNLINLCILELNNNEISEIPDSISKLVNLISLNFNNNSIVNVSNLSTLINLVTLSINNNPIDHTTLANLSITTLDLSLSNLINESLTSLVIPTSLKNLYLNNNNLSNLSSLSSYNLALIKANNQTINYGTLDESSDDMFFLDLSFLLDIDLSTPCINFISNYGECYQSESCDCDVIVWKNITQPTDVSFDFSNIKGTFSGTVYLHLNTTSNT